MSVGDEVEKSDKKVEEKEKLERKKVKMRVWGRMEVTWLEGKCRKTGKIINKRNVILFLGYAWECTK